MKSRWKEAEREYQALKEAGRLDEIETIPDSAHEKSKEVARRLLRRPYESRKQWQLGLALEED